MGFMWCERYKGCAFEPKSGLTLDIEGTIYGRDWNRKEVAKNGNVNLDK